MIVITGGAGFLGSNLTHALNAQDYADIALVDNLSADNEPRWQNINTARFRELVSYTNFFSWLNENSQEVEAIVHLGGPLGNAAGNSTMDVLLEAHYALPKMLWDWCTLAQRPFLYASSAATYGDGSNGFEDTFNLDYLHQLRPLTEYGFVKNLFDKWVGTVVARGEARPPQVVGLKFFNIFGPHEYHEPDGGFIYKTFLQAAANEPVTLLQGAASTPALDGETASAPTAQLGGTQTRDFIYVDDAMDVLTWFLSNPKVSGMFNIGTGNGASYFEAVSAVFQALYRTPLVNYKTLDAEAAARMAPTSVANITRLKNAGFKPSFMPLESAVQLYVENYLAPNMLYR